MPLPAAQSAFDPLLGPGNQWYWRADFVERGPGRGGRRARRVGPQMPTWMSTMHLYPIDGAASHVSNDATAWAYRDAKFAR